MIFLADTALPPLDLDKINFTPPALSVPIPAAIQQQMEDLSTTFFSNGAKFTVTFRSEGDFALKSEKRDPITPDKYFPVGEGRQINRPNCGPEALAMVLKGYDLNVSSDDIEGMSNFTSLAGTSPSSLRDVANKYGFKAVILNNSKFEEIASLLDKGGVCIGLVESGAALHYVAINGYKRGEAGEKLFFISDPSGVSYSIDEKEFSNGWKNVKFRGFDTGFSQAVIAISKDDVLPPERFSGKASFLSGVHSALNSTIRSGPVLAGLSMLALLRLRRRDPKTAQNRANIPAIPAAA